MTSSLRKGRATVARSEVPSAEEARLDSAPHAGHPWKKWGPYLSERQWGTVREDYSANGDAWNYFTHDQARSRAYKWGEDGIAGISDDRQQLCWALALWNGEDPIIKERLFGLANSEGNHGEDVKEYYYYLDSTPTHSYMNDDLRRAQDRTCRADHRHPNWIACPLRASAGGTDASLCLASRLGGRNGGAVDPAIRLASCL